MSHWARYLLPRTSPLSADIVVGDGDGGATAGTDDATRGSGDGGGATAAATLPAVTTHLQVACLGRVMGGMVGPPPHGELQRLGADAKNAREVLPGWVDAPHIRSMASLPQSASALTVANRWTIDLTGADASRSADKTNRPAAFRAGASRRVAGGTTVIVPPRHRAVTPPVPSEVLNTWHGQDAGVGVHHPSAADGKRRRSRRVQRHAGDGRVRRGDGGLGKNAGGDTDAPAILAAARRPAASRPSRVQRLPPRQRPQTGQPAGSTAATPRPRGKRGTRRGPRRSVGGNGRHHHQRSHRHRRCRPQRRRR